MPLSLPVVAVLAEAAARWGRAAGTGALAAALASNLAVCGLVLGDWSRLRVSADTLLTHSCPPCLADRLQAYPGASVYFTNIGLYQEALWASRAKVCGEDILNWGNEPGFASAVQRALERAGVKVFVAFPLDRERSIGGRALPRTDTLLTILRASGREYTTEVVRGPGVRPLYELFVVRSQALSTPRVTGGGVNPPSGGRVTGWVLGAGFRRGDQLSIEGETQPTTFGGAGLLTFVVDESRIRGQKEIRVEIVREASRLPGSKVTLLRP